MSDSIKNMREPNESTSNNTTQRVALSIGSALLDQVNPEYRAASQHVTITENATVSDVLEQVGLSTQASLLIVLNDTLVTRPQLAVQTLTNGDELSFMAPIHAG